LHDIPHLVLEIDVLGEIGQHVRYNGNEIIKGIQITICMLNLNTRHKAGG
jgi:hypothetical protein